MILYHYCTTDTFHSIICGKSIWLSSLSLSNDTMEGIWVRKILRELCVEKKLRADATERIIGHASVLNSMSDGLGFCLSEEGDMLSQWRGYAANGTGLSIGFSREYFEAYSSAKLEDDQIGYKLVKIEYDTNKQRAIVQPAFEKINDHINEGAFSSGLSILSRASMTDEEIQSHELGRKRAFQGLMYTIFTLFPKIFQLKNPAFSEEREWRLISHLVAKESESCDFRAVKDRIVPYREFGLLGQKIPPIREVVLGPKHITNVDVIEFFLNNNGFTNVLVRRSEATYR